MSVRDASASLVHRHAHALEHPIRIQILMLLDQRQLLSPVDLARELRLPLRRVTYHFHRLHVLGVIELAGVAQPASRDEAHYQLVPDATALVRRAWSTPTDEPPGDVPGDGF